MTYDQGHLWIVGLIGACLGAVIALILCDVTDVDFTKERKAIWVDEDTGIPVVPESPPDEVPGPVSDAKYYILQPGDGLLKIADRYDTTVFELCRLNGIENPDKIFAGERIRIR